MRLAKEWPPRTVKIWDLSNKIWDLSNFLELPLVGTSVDYWPVIAEQGKVHHPACSNANPNHNTNADLNPNPNPNPTADPN